MKGYRRPLQDAYLSSNSGCSSAAIKFHYLLILYTYWYINRIKTHGHVSVAKKVV